MNKKICHFLSIFVIGMGCLVLLGWQLDIPLIKSGFPGSNYTMKANTALAFLLAGLSLRLLQSQRLTRLRYRIAQTTALLVIIIGLLTVSEYCFGWNLGIDELFFKDRSHLVDLNYPGRMGINAAINFILIGISLLCLGKKTTRSIWLAQIFSSVAAIIALLTLFGYLFDINILSTLTVFKTTQAPHAALTTLIFYGGLLLTQPEQGIMKVITSPLIGGLMARWLIPWVIICPLVLNVLLFQGYKLGLYDLKTAYGIDAAFTIASFFFIVWRIAYVLNKIESDSHSADKNLRETQQQFKQAVEAAEIGTWQWDIVTGKVSLSTQCEMLLDLNSGSFLGTYEAFFYLLHHDDLDSIINSLEISRLNASRWQMEHQVFDREGNEHWRLSIGKFLYDETGQAVQMIGIIKDITYHKQTELQLRELNVTLENRVIERTTELRKVNNKLQEQLTQRHQIEEALQKYQARFAGILEIASDVIICVDSKQNIILFNQEAERVFGYTVAEVLGQSISLLLPEKFKIAHYQYIQQFIQGSQTKQKMGRRGEISGRRQDGTEFQAEASISKLGFGEEMILTVILRDISERKQIEESLRQKTAELEAIFQSIPDAIIVSNTNRHIQKINPAFTTLFGYFPNEVFGKTPEFLYFSSEAYYEQGRKRFSLNAKEQGKPYEISHRHKNGKVVVTETVGSTIKDNQQNILGFIGIIRDITERKQVEETLQKYANEITDLYNNAPCGYHSLDSNGLFIQINDTELNWLGYTREQIIGKLKMSDLLTPQSCERFGPNFAKFKQQGWVNGLEFEMVRADGTFLSAMLNSTAIKDAEGNFLMSRSTMFDISERKQTEKILQQTTTLQKAILDSANYTIISATEDGIIVTFNKAAERLLGYSAEEVIGKTTPAIIHDPNEIAQRARELSAEIGILIEPGFEVFVAKARLGGTDEREWSYIRKDGSCFPVLLSITVLRDAQDNITGFLGIASDITQRKQAESTLQKSEERLQLALEGSGDGLWDWNIETGEVYYSPRYLEMLGYEPGDLSPTLSGWQESVHPEDLVWVKKLLNAHIKEPSISYTFDYRIRTKSGAWKWIADYGKVVAWDKEGNPMRMSGTHKDISKRKEIELEANQAKEEAIAANRSKSIFLANMSHELRTPLNAILGFTQLLGRDNSLSSYHQERLQIINRSGEHLLELIDDILDLSKIETGQITLYLTNFDLHILLTTVEEMLLPKAEAKGLNLIIEKASDLPNYIQTDEKKLRQVLINLLNNAIKFTNQGNVTLRVKLKSEERPPYYLVFEVEDTGVGIAPDEIDSLFQIFVQAEAGKKLNQGAGLGLAISQKFVQLMGGKIQVQSILGQGSIFSFTIKVELVSSPNFSPENLKQKVVGLALDQPKYRILVVEDVWQSRCLLVELLSSIGFEVKEATNGAEALTLWENWSPHLIWMDMRMPVIDGYEATKRIKQTPLGQQTIIIALTANILEEQQQEILAAGCNDIVSKPFQESVILSKLSQHLGVKYIYETTTQSQQTFLSTEVLREALSTMSPEWIKEMYEAAYSLDADVMLELIEQIPSSELALAKALRELVINFNTEVIMELTSSLIVK